MITREEAKNLKIGDIIYDRIRCGIAGFPSRWRVNSKMQVWRKKPHRFEIVLVPDKGNFSCDTYLDEISHVCYSLTEDEVLKEREDA